MKDLHGIKLLILDCDGVLTDGKIIYDNHQVETKHFSAKDGLGIRLLSFTEISVAVISGRQSEILSRRCQDLHIEHLFQNIKNKVKCAEELIQSLDLTWDNVAIIGDDWNDYALMKKVHFSVVPADAFPSIKSCVDHITERSGGEGAVRELIELILNNQGIYDETLQKFFTYLNNN